MPKGPYRTVQYESYQFTDPGNAASDLGSNETCCIIAMLRLSRSLAQQHISNPDIPTHNHPPTMLLSLQWFRNVE